LKNNYIKSPLNYTGGKHKLLIQILPLFPTKINTFVDLFCGGCNVGINVDANKIIFNDNLTYLIEVLEAFKNNSTEYTLNYIDKRIEEFQLSMTNETGYKDFKKYYNENRIPLDLFVLIAYSFNNQFRFNANHEYNTTIGRNRSQFNKNMRKNLINFTSKLRKPKKPKYSFSNISFEEFDFSKLSKSDLVYCDPPYLISNAPYNNGKRGFKGWNEKEEYMLLEVLDKLDELGIRFALSNVLEHKGSANLILKKWLSNRKYLIHYLDSNYAYSSYKSKNRDTKSTMEVLITNYTL